MEDMSQHDLVCVVVKFGLGSKVIKAAKKKGVSGGTIFIGRGTVSNRILNLLGVSDIRKEIVFMITDKRRTTRVLHHLNNVFHFDKRNHGIVFTTSISSLLGTRSCTVQYDEKSTDEESGEDQTMYQNISVIVDRGNAEDVIDAAMKAGSKGGTIMNARGSGVHETGKLFSMNIEPEKELVMILSEEDKTDDIVRSIRNELNIDEPGKGIIFVQEVSQTMGIYE
ncbi:nitrogen regulatory protein P-II [Gracilibacillus halophilus YIM-C55.5]|uniref:Nitrogen regulatory protein P-II n=1 Tax=Gracilibacillus halophilus YIM-C55.5 TaxID=1308866 RepID=N4WIY9_9BACI|nr:P-II family nitrogen regulator [Gracilibacillus halophilus]ENH96092.1 nitrogen regulatory protein P-II [Gracilibacillus halophilus YIM-C55.5]